MQVYVNGVPIFFLELFAGDRVKGFDSQVPRRVQPDPPLTKSGPQSITTKVFGDDGCEPNTTLERLRIIVTEVGLQRREGAAGFVPAAPKKKKKKKKKKFLGSAWSARA